MKIQGKKWKKRYYILTDSGLRFYAQQPVIFSNIFFSMNLNGKFDSRKMKVIVLS